jgi:hypothetical protein
VVGEVYDGRWLRSSVARSLAYSEPRLQSQAHSIGPRHVTDAPDSPGQARRRVGGALHLDVEREETGTSKRNRTNRPTNHYTLATMLSQSLMRASVCRPPTPARARTTPANSRSANRSSVSPASRTPPCAAPSPSRPSSRVPSPHLSHDTTKRKQLSSAQN